MKKSVALMLSLGLIVVSARTALAAAGDLDPSFSGNGIVRTHFHPVDFANAVVIQPDGKIVAAGIGRSDEFALSRYDTDGTLDTTFGSDGKVHTRFHGIGTSVAFAVAIQPDLKIVAAGRAGPVGRFALVRYNPDGTLDANFGRGGKVTTDLTGRRDGAYALVIQANGKIVAAGAAREPRSQVGGNPEFAIARYRSDGTLDPTFGGDGTVITNFTHGFDVAFSLVASGRKMVAAGTAGGFGGKKVAVARYNPDGSLDGTFDANGKLQTNVTAGDDAANGVVIQPDGMIVAAGTGGFGRFALARYDSGGSLDAGFGIGGVVLTDFTADDDIAHAVALQADEKIVAAGSAAEGSGRSAFALARYNTDGTPDSGFGSNGEVTTDVTSDEDVGHGVAIDVNGIVVAGSAAEGTDHSAFAVARYLAA
jgi:uncharacterized delta-60 repeat protein